MFFNPRLTSRDIKFTSPVEWLNIREAILSVQWNYSGEISNGEKPDSCSIKHHKTSGRGSGQETWIIRIIFYINTRRTSSFNGGLCEVFFSQVWHSHISSQVISHQFTPWLRRRPLSSRQGGLLDQCQTPSTQQLQSSGSWPDIFSGTYLLTACQYLESLLD